MYNLCRPAVFRPCFIYNAYVKISAVTIASAMSPPPPHTRRRPAARSHAHQTASNSSKIGSSNGSSNKSERESEAAHSARRRPSTSTVQYSHDAGKMINEAVSRYSCGT
jgi:hypothetical protein